MHSSLTARHIAAIQTAKPIAKGLLAHSTGAYRARLAMLWISRDRR